MKIQRFLLHTKTWFTGLQEVKNSVVEGIKMAAKANFKMPNKVKVRNRFHLDFIFKGLLGRRHPLSASWFISIV